MPTLFSFLMIVRVIARAITGSLYVLAEYLQPRAQRNLQGLAQRQGARLDETTARECLARGAVDPASAAEGDGAAVRSGRQRAAS